LRSYSHLNFRTMSAFSTFSEVLTWHFGCSGYNI
jgi:hypothetical protein